MRRTLPSLTALQCFETSARHLNFTRAAGELNLTQSAVSRQVRNLEERVGVDLFVRNKKNLALTDPGKVYAREVAGILERLESETLQLMAAQQSDTVLNLGTYPTFGSRCLIPMLQDFTTAHPDIQLDLVTGTEPFDLLGQGLDVAIQYGEGDWPGVTAHRITGEKNIVVCSPDLISAGSELPPSAIKKFTLLRLRSRLNAWRSWLRSKGFRETISISGPCFQDFGMIIRAAQTGLGLAVLPTLYVGDELAAGRLVAPFGDAVDSENAYYLVHLPTAVKAKKITAFRDWLLHNARSLG